MTTMFRLACALVVCLFAADAYAAPTTDDDIVGIWAYRTEYNVGPAGELTVTHNDGKWRASIADVSADGTVSGKEIRFVFPGDNGSYRGHLSDNGRTIDGMWRRREVTDDPRYPEGEAQAYAMPVLLSGDGKTWHGAVTPLPDTFTLYLKIFRNPDGKLAAAFRNPETHDHGPAMQLAVERKGDTIVFSTDAEHSITDKPESLEATFIANPRSIRIVWNGIKRTIDLTPRTPQEAQNFFPRPPGEQPYVYRVPPVTDDGWQTARAADTGMDEAALVKAVQRLINVDPSAQRGAWLVHSIAVAHGGKLVLEEYFYGHDRDTPHDTRSLGKTWGSVLVGAAMYSGVHISPSSRLYEMVAPMGPFANPDPRKARITLAHVMSHSTGLDCDDNAENPQSPGNEDLMESQRVQPNWWKFILDQKQLYEPGTHYAYASGCINLTGAMLTYATHTSVPELWDRLVARPLQWKNWYWNVQPTGEGYLGGGSFVRTRDILKIGQLWLNGGTWNGKRIVSADWTRWSVSPHMRVSPETTGVSGDTFANNYVDGYDAWAWHPAPLSIGGRTYQGYFGNGNGGQMLIVIPEADLAVAFTAGNYRQGLWWQLKDFIVRDLFIPAIHATN